MNWNKSILVVALLWIASASLHSAPLTGEDADGKKWRFDQPGRITVVLCNSATSAKQARAAGRALYPFQGRKDFRMVVVVNLRGSAANWAKGYTERRIVRDLDTEAERLIPYYRQNGNEGNPRHDIGAIADFDGSLTDNLGWATRAKHLRAILYDRQGREAIRFENLQEMSQLHDAVAKLLNQR